MTAIYVVTAAPEDYADFILQGYGELARRVAAVTPPAEVEWVSETRLRFRFTAVGVSAKHRVSVNVELREDGSLVASGDRYPYYVVSALLAFTQLPGYRYGFAVDTGKSTRALLTADKYTARETVVELLERRARLINPYDLEEASFEGALYETPVGRVAFLVDWGSVWRQVDFIEGHEEKGESPWLVARQLAVEAWKKLLEVT